MALPPYVFEEARAQAAEHVQLEVLRIGQVDARGSGGRGVQGVCPVEGRVARVFRGRLRIGDVVTLGVACASRDAELPVGGTQWTDFAALRAARALEAYLAPAGVGYEVVRDQIYIVPALRSAPYCTVREGCVIPVPAPPKPANPLIAWWESLFPKR
jgi:hypothetical protein